MKGRPAESITGAAAIGVLLSVIFGIKDVQTISAMVAGLGLLPAAVSLVVSNGGLIGIGRLVLRGRRQGSPPIGP